MRRRTDDQYIDEDNFEIPDGGHVKVPLYLSDAVRFEDDGPHFMRMADERFSLADQRFGLADQAFDGFRSGYLSARDARTHDARTAASDAYLDMVKRAESAWKRPPTRDFAEPDYGTRPPDLQLMRRGPLPHDDPGAALERHLFSGPGSDQPGESETAQRKRDDAYQKYVNGLQNAWKTNPRAAVQIERQGERWRGGR
jgi:hypothetical protein